MCMHVVTVGSKSCSKHSGGIEGVTINYLFKGRIGRKALLWSVIEYSVFL